MCLLKLGLLGTLVGCGPVVTKYTVDARVSAERVDATQSWGALGERFRVPGIRNASPTLEELQSMEELTKWSSYTDERACFHIVSYQRIALLFPDGQGNQKDEPLDWSKTKHELTTSSGQTLKPEPADIQVDSPFEVTYESLDAATNTWVPATERYVHAEVEVCFATPKPLKQEKWVRWAYTTHKKARIEITFKVQPGG